MADLKLLCITTSFPRGTGDPSGAFVEELASTLRPLGFDTRVVRMAPTRGGPLSRFETGVWRDRFALGMDVARMVPDCLQAADLVLAHWLLPSAVLGALRPGRPVVGVVHGGDGRVLERIGFPRVQTAFTRRLAGVIAVSSELGRRIGHPNTLVTPMGVSRSSTPVPPRPRRGAGDPLKALFVGRLVPIKGAAILIEAVRGLDEVQLTVVGEGPELEPLSRAAPWVRFTGPKTPAEVRQALRQADVLCVPSVGDEGMPRVVFEAAAEGCPVLASRIGGLPEQVPAECLLPPGDVPAWRGALTHACSAPLPSTPLLGWDTVAARVADFLTRIVEERSRN